MVIERLTPAVMIGGASEFLKAAQVAGPTFGDSALSRFRARTAPFVVYYLVGHSIELALKAFLLHRGATKASLKGMGHNLLKITQEARRRKLGREVKLAKAQLRQIEILNMSYMNKMLEYAELGTHTLPKYPELLETNQVLVDGIRAFITRSR